MASNIANFQLIKWMKDVLYRLENELYVSDEEFVIINELSIWYDGYKKGLKKGLNNDCTPF